MLIHRKTRYAGNSVTSDLESGSDTGGLSLLGIYGKIRNVSKNKNIYVLKHPSIGEIPTPMKQRLGLSPNGSMTRKSEQWQVVERTVIWLGDGFRKH